MSCPLCGGNYFKTLYIVSNIPIFQNKMYDTPEEAAESLSGKIDLVECFSCGFIFNQAFNSSVMDYDELYQNEQTYSVVFKEHVSSVIDMLEDESFSGKKIIEIGCGKGTFLGKLRDRGFDAIGFDPAYEGDDPSVVKEYFTNKFSNVESDLVVLRHTLEHIQDPFNFLRDISSSCNSRGSIYIEVPDYDWIQSEGAFWDICHEHCNYFTEKSLSSMFHKSKTGKLFGGQYIYLLAELKDLRNKFMKSSITKSHDSEVYQNQFCKYESFFKDNSNVFLWGAGTKGVLIANLLDPNRNKVSFLVDINPKKQNKYVALTGHRVISDVEARDMNCSTVLVMNENYLPEVNEFLKGRQCRIYSSVDI